MTDTVPLIKDVLFVGEHFTLMTSVVIDTSHQNPGESDDEFAMRMAAEGLKQFYGWNVGEMANDVAIVE